ncbi:hypothetical protein F5B20DRAFT_571101 [Whalleya microplaca]|nr:hypothetical protein F5B20DRAFT_571101 [Whalleya microplaca]
MSQEEQSNAIELSFPEPGGYKRLAEHISRHPELSIYQRYDTLANENLLFYQAELAQVESSLRYVQERDRKSGDESCKQYAVSWYRLSQSANLEDPNCIEGEQYQLIMKLRELMAGYQKALFYQSKMLSLRRPHRKHLEDLRQWMRRPTMGRIRIMSQDWRTWETCEESELLTFENSMMDGFTSWITYTLIDIYHNLLGRHIHKKRTDTVLPLNYADHRHTVTYSHKSIARFTQAITVLLACMLPIGAIVLLYSVENITTRLGIIACLTGVFSISMNMFTMATLPEIFAATAA